LGTSVIAPHTRRFGNPTAKKCSQIPKKERILATLIPIGKKSIEVSTTQSPCEPHNVHHLDNGSFMRILTYGHFTHTQSKLAKTDIVVVIEEYCHLIELGLVVSQNVSC